MFICVDFDGTIVDHDFPNIGAPNPGAIEYLLKWQSLGAKIILFTMRSDYLDETSLSEAVAYISAHGIKLFGINENPTQKDWTRSPKAYGHIYVDDASFGCPLHHPEEFKRHAVDWRVVGPKVEAILQANVALRE